MKKYIYTAMFILIGFTIAQAQRMLPKQKGLEVNAGTLSDDHPDRNYYLNIAMTVNGKNGNYQIWALEYTHQYDEYKDFRLPQETYTAEGGYSFFLLGDARKNISLNAAITGVLGYESINRGEAQLYDESTGNYSNTQYYLRYFQNDGQGTLQYYNALPYLPNDLYQLPTKQFKLYYTSHSTVSQSFDVWISDNFGNEKQLSFEFNSSN